MREYKRSRKGNFILSKYNISIAEYNAYIKVCRIKEEIHKTAHKSALRATNSSDKKRGTTIYGNFSVTWTLRTYKKGTLDMDKLRKDFPAIDKPKYWKKRDNSIAITIDYIDGKK